MADPGPLVSNCPASSAGNSAADRATNSSSPATPFVPGNPDSGSSDDSGTSDSVASEAEPPTAGAAASGRSQGRLFPLLLVVAAAAYFGFVGYRLTHPPQIGRPPGQELGFLARCKELCEQYGLLPSGDLARDAKAYLEKAQPNPLRDRLEEILADSKFQPVASQSHALIGRDAPDFELLDSRRQSVRRSGLAAGRPMIVVFYYGYWCNHCVAQLFGLDKDRAYFQELDAEIVAISADEPEHTAEKFKEYGQFSFPVLSDPDNRIAEAYGIYTRPKGDEAELLDHGTFVVDASGKVVWANQGPEPFLDNKTLLFMLDRARRSAD